MKGTRFVLVLPGKAVACLVRDAEGVLYWDYVRVRERCRRSGIGTELVKLAAAYLRRWPLLDIRCQSKVAQRIAARLGYRRIGRSQRYLSCDLWVRDSQSKDLPSSRLMIINIVPYQGMHWRTEVLYLREDWR